MKIYCALGPLLAGPTGVGPPALERNRGGAPHGAGWRRCRLKSDELAARIGREGGARGAPECGGPDLRCGEGLTGVGLSVVARFGHRGMSVRESSGGCGGRLEV
jgi:hypothetical protein